MNRKQQNTQQSSDGFSDLIDSYTFALKDNSDVITDMLEELSKRKLSKADKEELKKINRDLNSIDKQINKLGK